jgi:hypothetical protein
MDGSSKFYGKSAALSVTICSSFRRPHALSWTMVWSFQCNRVFTTGERKFPECLGLPRLPNIGHSGKKLFFEYCTRGRNALGEEPNTRVPHPSTRGSKPLPRVPHPSTRGREALGEEFFCFLFFSSFFLKPSHII